MLCHDMIIRHPLFVTKMTNNVQFYFCLKYLSGNCDQILVIPLIEECSVLKANCLSLITEK